MKAVPMIMPVTSMMPMLLRAPAPGPVAKTSGRWPDHGGGGRHQDRPQARAGGLDDRRRACRGPARCRWLANSTIRMPFFGDQADERDQPDLAVDVERGEAEEREQQRARQRQRHRAGEDDERVAEALELRREHQVDQDRREQERAEELAALGAELARLAGVVDGEPARQDASAPPSRGSRAPGRATPAAGSRPGSRTALSCWKRFSSRGCGRGLERREGRERHQPCRSGR